MLLQVKGQTGAKRRVLRSAGVKGHVRGEDTDLQ